MFGVRKDVIADLSEAYTFLAAEPLLGEYFRTFLPSQTKLRVESLALCIAFIA